MNENIFDIDIDIDTTMINPTFIFVDGSYYCFHRYYALQRWWKSAYPDEPLTIPAENEAFVQKYKKTFINNLKSIPRKLNIRKDPVKPILIVGKDCPRENIWRMDIFKDYKGTRTLDDGFMGGPFFKMAYEEDLFQQGGALFIANDTNAKTIESTVGAWQTGETEISITGTLRVHNPKAEDVLVMFERMAWTDQAATAAEVTALQMFRDLFSSEALRAGEHISVGQLTVVFTDLKGSTKMYQQIGDAPAFGVVLEHFDIIKSAIADYDGAIVKNIGDAIMAVFKRPANAIQAMLRAQKALAHPPKGEQELTLRSGMHQGVCIAVNLNNRLDYFGTTVNKAARLEGKSSGTDVVVSIDVFNDPEVQALIAPNGGYVATPFEDELKGFEGKVKLYRISLAA